MATELAPWQFLALNQPYEHFCWFGGIATGKTFGGSHFALKMIEEHPDLTGLIGANTYDQLSQATLRETIYWLDEYKYDYVIDQRPPLAWGGRKEFKTYKNILSVRPKSKRNCIVSVFTRVMSAANPLRGIEFGWYWLDETRDTPRNTFEVVLSRMRQHNEFRKGLTTTTTNGEDWSHETFVRKARAGQRLYGAMHVPTRKSVECGIISQSFYDMLLQSYSALMAAQELDALHVNVKGGRAYYSAGEHNRMRRAPWGDQYPTTTRPLVIGCDFNFSPAPMVWMVGQIGPDLYSADEVYWGNKIHWFKELSGVEVGSTSMAIRLVNEFGTEFFYEVYGDMSGNIGTSSNAGKTDFDQIGEVLSEAGCQYSIAVEQMAEEEAHINPRVRSRVENMNRMFQDAVGNVNQTYDPVSCPLFDADCRMVGWKPHTLSGRGKLDDGGDKQRTHASDGAGYAIYKKFPPGVRTRIIESVPSVMLDEIGREY